MRSNGVQSFTERARRDQIVRAAIELLADGGYSAASLAAIANKIGASKGVILYHFDGKDELLQVVVSTVLAEAAAHMSPGVEAAVGASGKLRAYIESNMAYLDTHRADIRALTAVLTGLPPGPGGVPAYASAGQDAVAALAALVRAGQRTGEFRPVSAAVVARSLRAAIDAVSELLRVEPDLDVAAYSSELLALFEPGVLS